MDRNITEIQKEKYFINHQLSEKDMPLSAIISKKAREEWLKLKEKNNIK
ncbi:MAG: hypothetical protein I3273_04905 [Candidatus Moeniiplasma glomeromycotorum]|nr:hypothetical protein [Candidatus Moeniiplasma glomeromycotorum]MCE8167881.1 hypothetical protein [Candidatus Moeniiplasma glomeromycotorum]MCE8169306.1 hypothetical protein [Candidatus Moeniiplasma glomeromycotorum]MCE8169431.1 hypothetical protein [Candidatus Moeniiplasma glomeromycotorum]